MLKVTDECTACGACLSICPKNCISFKSNEEGFLYPHIDIEKCVDCDLCSKVCFLNDHITPTFRENDISYYAAKAIERCNLPTGKRCNGTATPTVRTSHAAPERKSGRSRRTSRRRPGSTGRRLFQFRTGSHELLALLVAGELREVLDEATCEVLGLHVPILGTLVGVARIEDLGIHTRQSGRDLEVEDRQRLGLGLVDRAVEDGVDDAARILDRDTLARAVPTRVHEIGRSAQKPVP